MTDLDTVIGPARPQARPGLAAIAPYVGGKAGEPGMRAVKLSANENPYGPSAKAMDAYRAVAGDLALYPDGGAHILRERLAEHHGLEAERVVCGAGSDEILQLLVRAYAGPGDEVLHSAHGFLVYALAAQQVGAQPVAAPEVALTSDVDALLARVNARTRLVMLAYPNNPTGTYLPGDEIARLHAGLPGDVVLVLDGAYAEYAYGEGRADYDDGMTLAKSAANVVVTRTFSKVYGLAALRLGWAYGPQAIIDVLHRVRAPFNVTAPALAAGVAALGDQAHVAASVAHNADDRAKLGDAAQRLGVLAAPSAGNFVLLRFGDGDQARAVNQALETAGLLVRPLGAYGLDAYLRVTVGRADDTARVIVALEEAVAALS